MEALPECHLSSQISSEVDIPPWDVSIWLSVIHSPGSGRQYQF